MTRTDVPIDSNRVLWIDSINQLFKCYLVIRNVISLQLLYLVVLSSLKAILPDACTLLPIAQQLQSSYVTYSLVAHCLFYTQDLARMEVTSECRMGIVTKVFKKFPRNYGLFCRYIL